ncbi:hypothetical protein LFL97_38040 (plasmid) [Burkholderia sp. JSH-S8]|uniref:hypothetical protein n=1 Tax=Burkholderia stagnalis TaxID=1503054 RepID=UPI0009D93DA2|nr:hypothetical protein [Burkholderia stagnalis]WGS48057.1 hypothetical protein LFL97_38040 [Burkholderia sp. JSH-S8]
MLMIVRWLPLWWRTPRLCLWLLVNFPLPFDACLPSVVLAQRRVQRGNMIIECCACKEITPGDTQAKRIYGSSVALGYYDLVEMSSMPPLRPVGSSKWTSDQLESLRRLGIRHGADLRDFL